MGANVLVEFENICLNWGHFFTIGGIFFKLGAKNYLGILRIIWTPAGWQYFYLEKIYVQVILFLAQNIKSWFVLLYQLKSPFYPKIVSQFSRIKSALLVYFIIGFRFSSFVSSLKQLRECRKWNLKLKFSNKSCLVSWI